MKTTFCFSLVLAAALAAAAAQEPAAGANVTPAEQAFREGWWAESGQGDLGAALTKYLASVAAEGPANVRGKALLHVGALQQRLGKAESAIATFRQLLKEHPAEADLVERARVHLRELTAVDLTTGYDEWYERRLFSEDVQLLILKRIEALGDALAQSATASQPGDRDTAQRTGRTIREELLAYGRGVIPALRKTCGSGSEQLANEAIEMLFTLGEVPPPAALKRWANWRYDSSHWLLLLRQRQQVPPSPGASPAERLVDAALRGPVELTEVLLAMRTLDPSDEVGGPAGVAAMIADAACRQRLQAAMTQREAPIALRRALQRALVEGEYPPEFTAAEWLVLGADPLVFDLRVLALRMAGRHLGSNDGALLDQMFERVAMASDSTRGHFLNSLGAGLRQNPAALLVPWTKERLQRLVLLGCRTSDGEAPILLSTLRGDDSLRVMLAAAIFADPLPVHGVLFPAVNQPAAERSLTDLLQWQDVEEAQAELLSGRWHRDLAGVLSAGWSDWTPAQRGAALAILQQAAHGTGDSRALTEFLRGVRGAAPAEQQAAIDATVQTLSH